jgi:hypothetical protein
MKRARVMVDLYRSWPLAVDPPRRSWTAQGTQW